jgi:ABC-type branched-subunit amino acid transport system substrate-binding protein
MRIPGLPTFAAALASAALLPLTAASAQEAYNIGVTAAMTGPAAGTQAPVIEMLRIYVDRLNANGGINGHRINLMVEDDQAEPSKAAANATKLIRQNNVSLLIESSLSSTFGPVIAEAKRAGVPLWFAGAVCPKETHPPKPDPVLFCSTGFDFGYDIPVAVQSIKDAAKEPVRIGMIGMPIPISRIGIDNAQKQGEKLGMVTVDTEFIPPTAADYTPFATKLKAADPNWAFAYAPWSTEVKTFEALRRLGWTGTYLCYGHIQAEDELTRIADGGLQVFSANALFQDNLPVQNEIREVAAQGKYSYPATYADEGWITGRALEQILSKTGWPASAEKITAAMTTLNLDTQGLRGGPLVWTADNHFRTRQYYRFYRYDPDKKSIARLRDWLAVDVVD